MAAVTSAVTSAASPAVNPDWLADDTTPGSDGRGPTPYGYPLPNETQEPLPGSNADGLTVSPPPMQKPAQAVYEPSSGYWPGATQGGFNPQGPAGSGYGPAARPEDKGPSQPKLPGAWSSAVPIPTGDYLAQSTDTHGIQQTVPNDRTAYLRQSGQANPGNYPLMNPVAERPVTAHLAVTSVAANAYQGVNGGIGIADGSLPEWDYLNSGGDFAYETPASPAPQQVQPVQFVDPAAVYFNG
jgi:hypothetical protein